MAETEMKHIKTFHTILFILIAAAGIHCSLFQSSPQTDYESIVSELAPGLQSFQINPDRVSTITGGIGTRLIIPIGKMGVARFLVFKEERFNVIYHYKDDTSPFDVKDESFPKSSSVPAL